jgi:hypothetical protein
MTDIKRKMLITLLVISSLGLTFTFVNTNAQELAYLFQLHPW